MVKQVEKTEAIERIKGILKNIKEMLESQELTKNTKSFFDSSIVTSYFSTREQAITLHEEIFGYRCDRNNEFIRLIDGIVKDYCPDCIKFALLAIEGTMRGILHDIENGYLL
ncbi:MAG: hypothetical protein C0173_02475 [Desulfurella sp.]|uniref:hypothetical protein n=1 Tax=Desulfurella sp. TaxID=1962857 RepID=UPI000CC5A92A|nr:hypothetical protein [Desulfurella sp.]PMP92224.1 MAG: hypothetical protein C0173_02475 [Desulfurella sp.]